VRARIDADERPGVASPPPPRPRWRDRLADTINVGRARVATTDA
jgi:hypothetical protein